METHGNGSRACLGGVVVIGLLLLSGRAHPAAPDPAPGGENEPSALEIFKQRILPIFRSSKPSSCTECHLGNVDLKDYISRDQAKTFASLRKAGLVDLKNPDESKILKLIKMEPQKPNPISAEMRKKEFDAFQAWIREAVKEPKLAAAKVRGKATGPSVPDEVIRHARKDRLLASFIENVWTERMRCWGCHGPGDPANAKMRENKQKWIKKYGANVLLWLKSDNPEEAMDNILKSRIINLKQPAKSLILTKPTKQVKHDGGKKMTIGDRGYRQFLRFIDDFAKIRTGKYRKEKDLPGTVRTRQWLRVRGVPSQRPVLMQVDFHRKERGRWSTRPFATAFGGVRQGAWQGPVEITTERTSKEFEALNTSRTLPAGQYQLRFYVDSRNKLQRAPTYRFGRQDLSGVMEITADGWPEESGQDVQPQQAAAKEISFPGGQGSRRRR